MKACEGLLSQYLVLGSFLSIDAFHLFCMQHCLYQPVAFVNPLRLPDLPYACRDVAPEWRCEVLFCDDSSRFESLNQLTERHTELAARRQQLQAKLDSANRVGAFLSKKCNYTTAPSSMAFHFNALPHKQGARSR